MRSQLLVFLIFLLIYTNGCAQLRAQWAHLGPEDSPTNQREARAPSGSSGVRLGMAMDEVTQVWGDPREVDTAGDPALGNQRWTYTDGFSSRYSLGGKKIVYFEEGRVVGWETDGTSTQARRF